MRPALTRFVAIFFVVALMTSWPVQAIAASDPYAIDLTRPTTGELKALLHARGLDAVADRLLVRHTVATPAPRGIRWGISYTTSYNWAGYVADFGTSGVHWGNEVRGWFNVRQVYSAPAVGTFTGIGGYRPGNLWQTGIDQYAMRAWVEAYPGPPTYTFSINNGDLMNSNVFDNRNGTWTLLIQDWTTGAYTVGTAGCCPDRSSVEWITEAQAGTPVPYFSSFQFTNSFYFYNYGGGPTDIDSPAAETVWNVTLTRGGSDCIFPGSLGADHRSFWMYHC